MYKLVPFGAEHPSELPVFMPAISLRGLMTPQSMSDSERIFPESSSHYEPVKPTEILATLAGAMAMSTITESTAWIPCEADKRERK
jgi:hypothetical protein